mmetsp:Transcript_108756/g.306483  ORF Transcript_108756/g.306483 Transcript_108756/m.306483 type:complete len:217 (-) Transcript_108756:129-779(-)
MAQRAPLCPCRRCVTRRRLLARLRPLPLFRHRELQRGSLSKAEVRAVGPWWPTARRARKRIFPQRCHTASATSGLEMTPSGRCCTRIPRSATCSSLASPCRPATVRCFGVVACCPKPHRHLAASTRAARITSWSSTKIETLTQQVFPALCSSSPRALDRTNWTTWSMQMAWWPWRGKRAAHQCLTTKTARLSASMGSATENVRPTTSTGRWQALSW